MINYPGRRIYPMQAQKSFVIHHLFDAPLLIASSWDERQAFLNNRLWPLVINHAHKEARKLAEISEGDAATKIAVAMHLKAQCDILVYAKDTSQLRVTQDGRIDFSYEHRNNNASLEVVENYVRPYLRESIMQNVLSPLVTALVMDEEGRANDLNPLMNVFYLGLLDSIDDERKSSLSGMFIDHEHLAVH
jgi:hypothetical protein